MKQTNIHTPFYGARAEKNPKADFAMKQTNICRLSGDINDVQRSIMYARRVQCSLESRQTSELIVLRTHHYLMGLRFDYLL